MSHLTPNNLNINGMVNLNNNNLANPQMVRILLFLYFLHFYSLFNVIIYLFFLSSSVLIIIIVITIIIIIITIMINDYYYPTYIFIILISYHGIISNFQQIKWQLFLIKFANAISSLFLFENFLNDK